MDHGQTRCVEMIGASMSVSVCCDRTQKRPATDMSPDARGRGDREPSIPRADVAGRPEESLPGPSHRAVPPPHKRPKQDSRTCRLCHIPVTMRMRRHVESMHLPWFHSPHQCCWTCRQEFHTGSLLRTYHDADQPGHNEQSTLTDDNLRRWALMMKGYLTFIAARLGCDSWDELLTLVRQNQWYPPDAVPSETGVLMYRTMDLCFASKKDQEDVRYQLSPPNRVSVLINWQILVSLLEQLDEGEREESLMTTVDRSVLPELPMTTIDSHCHMDNVLREYRATHAGDAWRKVKSEGEDMVDCTHFLCCLAFPQTWKAVAQLEASAAVYFQMGLHPHKAGARVSDQKFADLETLIQHPKCVAIGEVGLDYAHTSEQLVHQREFLERIAALAARVRKPIVIHARNDNNPDAVYTEVILLLEKYLDSRHPVYLHCFSGTTAQAQRWLTSFPGTRFGLGRGVLRASGDVDRMIMELPQDHILLETDAPHSFRHPWALRPVIQRIARLKSIAPIMVAEMAKLNALRFFSLPYHH